MDREAIKRAIARPRSERRRIRLGDTRRLFPPLPKGARQGLTADVDEEQRAARNARVRVAVVAGLVVLVALAALAAAVLGRSR